LGPVYPYLDITLPVYLSEPTVVSSETESSRLRMSLQRQTGY